MLKVKKRDEFQPLNPEELAAILPVPDEVRCCRCISMVVDRKTVYGNHDNRPVGYTPYGKEYRGFYWTHIETRHDDRTQQEKKVVVIGTFVHAETGVTYIFSGEQAGVVLPQLIKCGYTELTGNAVPHIPGNGDEWPMDSEMLESWEKSKNYKLPAVQELDEEEDEEC